MENITTAVKRIDGAAIIHLRWIKSVTVEEWNADLQSNAQTWSKFAAIIPRAIKRAGNTLRSEGIDAEDSAPWMVPDFAGDDPDEADPPAVWGWIKVPEQHEARAAELVRDQFIEAMKDYARANAPLIAPQSD